jgi:Leucine-rich repeat (LRR) protein/GTPase SAR1 family protein
MTNQRPNSKVASVAARPKRVRPKTIAEQLARNKETKHYKLTLSGTDDDPLSNLPEELFELTHLQELTLLNTSFEYLPDEFYALSSLKRLYIYESAIKRFPLKLSVLPKLYALTLNSRNLTEIPSEIHNWSTLVYLNVNYCSSLSEINGLPKNLYHIDISSTAINFIPKSIFLCHSLSGIGASNLGLTTLPIELGNLLNLSALDISSNQFSQIPPVIYTLKHLTDLTLDYNLITEVPHALTELQRLEDLSLAGNHIKQLPDSFKNLTNLKRIDLGYNNLTEFPSQLLQLPLLQAIWLGNMSYKKVQFKNNISYLPPSIINLEHLQYIRLSGNPITNVPAAIVEQGIQAIKSYFVQLASKPQDYLFEAKLLILGEAGAGKTSLTWKLENADCELPVKEDTTRGVDIRQYHFPVDAADFPEAIQPGEGRRFRLNLWDFGGQEIYKSTHRFFLSDQAVYLLVADSRNEDTDFAYWLHIQEIFGGKSPVLIIINERDERRRDLDEKVWKRLFGNIKDVRIVNLKEENKLRLTQLKAQLRSLAVELPHVGNPVPATWTIIRDALDADPRQRIEAHEYFDLCRANGITDLKDARILSKYFHDIGVFLHFQKDELLKHIIFLKPTWATNAVYKVLDHPLLLEHNGRFSRQEAANIWHEDEFAQVQDELLKLMEKFFLTYKVSDAAGYIVPEKLPYNSPNYPWDEKNNLVLEYKYEYFMPRGLMTQFIVQHHRYITNHELVWRHGVVLERHDTVAEVVETYITRTIKVRIVGKYKREFMTLITEALDAINEQYTNLKVEKFIPCNCSECAVAEEPHVYEFSDLQTRLERGKRTIECRLSYEDVVVSALMHEVFNPTGLSPKKPAELPIMLNTKVIEEIITTKPGKIFVSYSHKDVKYLNELQTHFDTLKYAGIEVDVWSDQRIEGGMKWKEEIKRAMNECQVAILLVSTPFLASNFVMTEELPTILAAAHERGVGLLSVVVGECRFTETPFLRNYQAMNEPSKPLSGLRPGTRDKVYMKLVDRARALLASSPTQS